MQHTSFARLSGHHQPHSSRLSVTLAGLILWGLAHAPQMTAASPPPPAEQAPLRRFELPDYLATAAVIATYLTVEFTLDGPESAAITGPAPLVDTPFRDLLRLRSASARDQADRLSDKLWTFSTVYPVAIAIALPLMHGRGFDQTWQLTMMNLQAFAVSSLLVRLPHKLLGRTRPTAEGCKDDPNYSPFCGSTELNLSFYGGHAAISMTGAGLACAHHQHADLLGGGLADTLGCAAALSVAGGVFVTRMMADKHWFTDQAVATILGLGVGYGLPTFLYYRPIFDQAAPPGHALTHLVLPVVTDGYFGATWLGLL